MIHACYSSPSSNLNISIPITRFYFIFIFFACLFFRGLSTVYEHQPHICQYRWNQKKKSVTAFSSRLLRAPLPTYTQKNTLAHAPHLTSIPPHSKTRNKPRSDARTRSTPTTCAQNVAPLSAVARAAACSQSPKSSAATPQKSMKTRVTTSGEGETRICAACSYDACVRKRSATYSCLSKSGSQNLDEAQSKPRNEKKKGNYPDEI